MSTTTEQQNSHHPMGPSVLHRRELCPASLRLEKDQPDSTSADADEGTDLHAVMADAIQHDGDCMCDQADADAIAWALSLAADVASNYPGAERLIERRISLEHIGCGFGTLDLAYVLPFDRGVVIDWKFGRVAVTPAAENVQLHAYALGVAHEFDLSSVEVVLAQPRLKRASSAMLAQGALAQAHARIAMIAAKCGEPNTRPSPGDHCRYCKAQAVCPAQQKNMTALAAVEAADELTAERLGQLLPLAEMAEKCAVAIKARAYALACNGAQIPGYGLVPGRSTRKWADGADLSAVAKSLGKPEGEIYQPLELRSPAQIEAAWGKSKKIREAIAPLIVSVPGRERLERIE